MGRRRTSGIGWPENPFDRLDLETLFSCGDECCLPTGWSWHDAEEAWASLGAEFVAEGKYDAGWALEAWGYPGEDPRSAPERTAKVAPRGRKEPQNAPVYTEEGGS